MSLWCLLAALLPWVDPCAAIAHSAPHPVPVVVEAPTPPPTPEPAARAAPPPNPDPGFIVPAGASRHKRTIIGEWRFYFGLDSDVSVPFAQVMQESRFRADAVSYAGATGLAQFMPATAAGYQRSTRLQELCAQAGGCPLSPAWAIRAMAMYDADEYADAGYAATEDERLAFMLTSYNGGRGWVRKERTAAHDRGLDDRRWFGAVERVCLRAAWACEESRGYAPAILYKWRPGFQLWLGGGR